jgi:hypothetical protein
MQVIKRLANSATEFEDPALKIFNQVIGSNLM